MPLKIYLKGGRIATYKHLGRSSLKRSRGGKIVKVVDQIGETVGCFRTTEVAGWQTDLPPSSVYIRLPGRKIASTTEELEAMKQPGHIPPPDVIITNVP